MRLIPGKTKVQIELFKGITLADVVIGIVSAAVLVFVMLSDIAGKGYWAIGFALIAVFLLVRIDEPNYVYLLRVFRHLAYRHRFTRKESDEELLARNPEYVPEQAEDAEPADSEAFPDEPDPYADETEAERKKRLKAERKRDDRILKDKTVSKEEKDAIWLKRAQQSAAKKQSKVKKGASKKGCDMSEIIGFTRIADSTIEYGGEYFGAVIEIPPVEFRFFSAYRRANSIENSLGRVLRSIPADLSANIVKLERPILFEGQLDKEHDRMDALRSAYESGVLREEEFKARADVLLSRYDEEWQLCNDNKVIESFYYLVLYNSDRTQLNIAVNQAVQTLAQGEMKARRLDTKELAVFLKYSNSIDFDEHEADYILPEDLTKWAQPSDINFQSKTTVVNGIVSHNLRVIAYPSEVDDAWLASLMTIPATKVVLKCKPMERGKALRSIDRSLQELRGQYMATGIDSKRMEISEHIETLNTLLAMLQGENEVLLEVNIFITAYDAMLTHDQLNPDLASELSAVRNLKRTVRRHFQEHGLRLNGLDFDQVNGFIGAQINAWDPYEKTGRGIPSNTVAACYPWIFATICDRSGIKLGEAGGVPVFIDFFRRDSERVNSNMVIVGKSGSGKSYATKSLLANLAADDAKIFILDPENEYTELAANLHGKFINVGNAQQGRMNPFHIITALDDDEEGGATGSYATHLQFLEEFFRQILPECDKESLEYLNSIIDRVYLNKNISDGTNLSALSPEDYPTFDDLYDAILTEFQSTDNEYIHSMLRTLINYIGKFSAGGRNANIWNGPSTITTEENFTVFNFQSLLANRNGAIANAQMLLVLKYIDNEIIKNRDYNTRNHASRKIVVVIDEAHVFIDTKYPAALDFMFQLAKRIRKYNGMQIVITQNIKDFVGSEELARKSAAIINACQYSFIFALAPNDMDDLCKLYEKSGGINESEQEEIVSAPRGQAFTILSPQSRSSFRVAVPQSVIRMFEDRDYQNAHFSGEGGEAAWKELIGESRAIHEEARNAQKKLLLTQEGAFSEQSQRRKVSFLEMDAAEFERELREEEQKTAAAQKSSVTFTEEDSETVLMTGEETPAAAASLQPAASVRPVYAAAPPQEDLTASILMDKLSQFSFEAMREEVRRSVQRELEEKLGGIQQTAPVYAGTDGAAELSEESESAAEGAFSPEGLLSDIADETPESTEESDDSDLGSFDFYRFFAGNEGGETENTEESEGSGLGAFDFSGLFAGDEGEKAENTEEREDSGLGAFDLSALLESLGESDEQDEEESSSGTAIGSIFNEDAMRMLAEERAEADKDTEEADGDAEDDFDLVSMLMEQATSSAEFTAFELMKEYGENKMEINLTDLIKYNQSKKVG